MYNQQIVLALVKARLNRLSSDISLDIYLLARIESASGELEQKGIHLQDNANDSALLCDYVVWQYGNRDFVPWHYGTRDTAGMMPAWLQLRIRERWLSEAVKR